MIRVAIVEDDDVVAEVNKHYLASIAGFHLVASARNCTEAHALLAAEEVDLLLLDIFMPGQNGLEFLAEVRARHQRVDVIVISAASDVENIQTALRLGATDYLIKPFEFYRFAASLQTYQANCAVMVKQQSMNQAELDALLLHPTVRGNSLVSKELPKGLTSVTFKRTVQEILRRGPEPFSTEELAQLVHISRISMRKYLMFLQDIGFLKHDLSYQPTGRPVHIYALHEKQQSVVDDFLAHS